LQGDLDTALKLLAEKKARAILSDVREGVILSADTVVVCGGQVFGKPKDEKDAFKMLRRLSGHTHQVKTGVCLLDAQSGKALAQVETTDVTFESVSDAQIDAYIQSGEPMDKAGAYAVQGLGAQFVRKINGCYYNVVGLPITLVLSMLRSMDALG